MEIGCTIAGPVAALAGGAGRFTAGFRMLAGPFFAATFLRAADLALPAGARWAGFAFLTDFFLVAADFFAVAFFFAEGFFAVALLAAGFFAVVFLAAGFFAVVFLFAGLRFFALAIPASC
jgi:hypothetical protein